MSKLVAPAPIMPRCSGIAARCRIDPAQGTISTQAV